MNPLYNLGIQLYSLGARLAACRSPKVRKMIDGQRAAIDHVAAACAAASGGEGFDIWFHAASLGEFEQARPMIERLRREHPAMTILLTFFSPSGYEVREGYDQVDCVAYLPFDKPSLVRRFLDAARPRMAVFVKYEFWGNYLEELHRRSIPTYIISAIFRPDQVFFRPYGGMMRGMLRHYDHLFVQDERSRQLLASIGIDRVTVAGDTRFDRVTDVMRNANYELRITNYEPLPDTAPGASAPGSAPASGQSLPGTAPGASAPGSAPAPGQPSPGTAPGASAPGSALPSPAAKKPVTIIVGSSWQPDEACYLPYLNAHPGMRWIIAPHEFDAERLAKLESQVQGKSVRLSAIGDGEVPADAQVIIVDCFGKLSSLYRYGDIAIIGGGFGAGIHNINEAAVYGIPVVFGPNHSKFKEATDLITLGGGYEYTDAASLAAILDRFTTDSAALATAGAAAGKYIKDNLGATDKIYKALGF